MRNVEQLVRRIHHRLALVLRAHATQAKVGQARVVCTVVVRDENLEHAHVMKAAELGRVLDGPSRVLHQIPRLHRL
jgi:hypothetical protein